jgi:hypothetical protein
MTKDPRILNITRGFRMKRSQVDRAIANCAVCWVEVGISVRNLTLVESIQARAEQDKVYEPLDTAELPNLVFKGPKPSSRDLIHAAHSFYDHAVL